MDLSLGEDIFGRLSVAVWGHGSFKASGSFPGIRSATPVIQFGSGMQRHTTKIRLAG